MRERFDLRGIFAPRDRSLALEFQNRRVEPVLRALKLGLGFFHLLLERADFTQRAFFGLPPRAKRIA